MTPEERALLNTIAQTVEENNQILRKVRRSMRWTTAINVLYWVLIVGSAVGAFYLVQPYINSVTSSYSGFQSDLSQFKSFISSSKSK